MERERTSQPRDTKKQELPESVVELKKEQKAQEIVNFRIQLEAIKIATGRSHRLRG
jgi:hypothetical protein